MTRPLPVTAYAAVSPDGDIDANFVCAEKDGIQSYWENVPVTIIPTEQYEAMVALLTSAQFIFQMCSVEYGCCMCGSKEEDHNIESGHSYVDQGSYQAVEWLKTAGVFLAALKEQDHEQG